jgi:transposase
MCRVLPATTEDAATWKRRLRHEHAGGKKLRRQMLPVLASGQAQTRQDVARLLGVHRHTIGHWLARYETGGLEA